jgi:anti-sigma factor RsiW
MNEMQVSKLSQRDLERLSAYLDGELNAKQTARLEARLEREPLLRDALEELRQTARLLRSMPKVTPPRRFTLTPEMVESQKTGYAYPALKLASALVAAAFVFVIGIDVFSAEKGSNELMPNMAQRSIAEAPAMEVDVEDAEDVAAAVGESEEPAAEEAAAPLAEPAAEAYEEDFAMEGGVVEPTQLPEAEIPAEEMEAPQEIAPEEPTTIGKTIEGGENEGEAVPGEGQWDGSLGAAATPTMMTAAEDEVGTGDREEQDREWSFDQVEPIHLLEIGLAILCIILISATLLLRVSSR